MNPILQKYYSSLYERTPLDMEVIDMTNNAQRKKERNFLEFKESKDYTNVVLLYERNHACKKKDNAAKNGIMQTI